MARKIRGGELDAMLKKPGTDHVTVKPERKKDTQPPRELAKIEIGDIIYFENPERDLIGEVELKIIGIETDTVYAIERESWPLNTKVKDHLHNTYILPKNSIKADKMDKKLHRCLEFINPRRMTTERIMKLTQPKEAREQSVPAEMKELDNIEYGKIMTNPYGSTEMPEIYHQYLIITIRETEIWMLDPKQADYYKNSGRLFSSDTDTIEIRCVQKISIQNPRKTPKGIKFETTQTPSFKKIPLKDLSAEVIEAMLPKSEAQYILSTRRKAEQTTEKKELPEVKVPESTRLIYTDLTDGKRTTENVIIVSEGPDYFFAIQVDQYAKVMRELNHQKYPDRLSIPLMKFGTLTLRVMKDGTYCLKETPDFILVSHADLLEMIQTTPSQTNDPELKKQTDEIKNILKTESLFYINLTYPTTQEKDSFKTQEVVEIKEDETSMTVLEMDEYKRVINQLENFGDPPTKVLIFDLTTYPLTRVSPRTYQVNTQPKNDMMLISEIAAILKQD